MCDRDRVSFTRLFFFLVKSSVSVFFSISFTNSLNLYSYDFTLLHLTYGIGRVCSEDFTEVEKCRKESNRSTKGSDGVISVHDGGYEILRVWILKGLADTFVTVGLQKGSRITLLIISGGQVERPPCSWT